MKNKIILYDHQRLYLDCMTCFLNHNKVTRNYQVEVYDDFEKVENSIDEKNSILILNSIGLNSLDMLIHIENFLKKNPTLKIIIHSTNMEVRAIKKLFDKGIKGYLGSDTDRAEFFEAIAEVSNGKVFITYDVKNALLNAICCVEEKPERKYDTLDELTAREKDVLMLICEGLRSKEIADKLFISVHTVESHRRNMMQKFNLNCSSKLVKFAMENKLVVY